MADDADSAGEKEEVTLAAYIRAIRDRAGTAMLAPTGYCWNCGEATGNRLFCAAECRGDYDERQRLRQIGGNPKR